MVLPEDFITNAKAVMGEGLYGALSQGLGAEALVSIRLNAAKCEGGGFAVVDGDGRVPWCGCGFYLKSRPNFTFDPLFHAGMYYVQEASSMFLAHVLEQHGGSPAAVLDLCAAPGGKSTAARAVLPAGCLLVCNEPVRARAQVLAENIQKFGSPDVIVTNNYPKDFSRSGLSFDIVIADVPCSGEGMFRKDPAAVGEWSLQNVERCRRLQRSIVADVWDCLKPGGLLVYSTCTFNTKENEENVMYICDGLGADVIAVDIRPEWNIMGSLLRGYDKPVYRFLPGISKGEGLFMAVLRKHGEALECSRKAWKKEYAGKKDRGRRDRNDGGVKPDMSWLRDPDAFEPISAEGAFSAIPKGWKCMYDTAAKSLRILSAGVPLGEVKGKDVVPSQALALSTQLCMSAFNCVELDYGRAVSYLRKEAVPLPPDTPRGYVLVTYKGVPLGFEKNIGNRANNLYPADWKIKSTHTPDGNTEVLS